MGQGWRRKATRLGQEMEGKRWERWDCEEQYTTLVVWWFNVLLLSSCRMNYNFQEKDCNPATLRTQPLPFNSSTIPPLFLLPSSFLCSLHRHACYALSFRLKVVFCFSSNLFNTLTFLLHFSLLPTPPLSPSLSFPALTKLENTDLVWRGPAFLHCHM